MRYLIAFFIAALIIAGGVWFARGTWRWLDERTQAAREAAHAEGRVPPDGDADQADAPDVTFELTEAEVLRVKIAYALTHYWYLYGSVVLLVCFGIAFLLRNPHTPASMRNPPS